MATTNVWRAGAVDSIYSPSAWTNGPMQPGQTLVIGSGTAYIGDAGLKSSTIVLSGQTSATPPALVAYANANVNVLVQQEIAVGPTGIVPAALGTIEVSGGSLVHLTVAGNKYASNSATINIDGYSQMQGGFVAQANNALVRINGGATSSFANISASTVGYQSAAFIGANVVGAGSFHLVGFATVNFAAGVSSGQTIYNYGGSVIVQDPRDFHAAVNLGSTDPATGAGGHDTMTLVGLVADRDTYAGGVLSLFSGTHNVFSMHLNATGPLQVGFAATGVTLSA